MSAAVFRDILWIALKIAVVLQFGYHAVPFTYQGF